MKIIGIFLAFLVLIGLTRYGLQVFEAGEKAGIDGLSKYVGLIIASVVGGLVVGVVSYFRGRRPWLWAIFALPSPIIALRVLLVKKDEGWG
jgi:hypothetical protein